MDGMWILAVCVGVVCCAMPGSAQDSANVRILYLISGSEVLHGGMPTRLAVTVLADSPIRVTAEVTHGNTSVALAEDTLQGGLTAVLTLPPIPGSSISQGSPFTLAVRGYQGSELLFTNTTTLSFNRRNVYTFIQTDRSRYRPLETVRVRVVSVQLDNRPYRGGVDISIRDPRGNMVQRWDSKGSHMGIVSTEFNLSQTPPLGQWAITAAVDGTSDEKAFIVEDYDPPPFEVLVQTAPEVLVGGDISGTVKAQHRGGQPVQGTLSVSITLASALYNSSHPFILNQTQEIYGSTQFFFSKDQLLALRQYSTNTGTGDGGCVVVYVTAHVTESSTGFKVKRTADVQVAENMFQLTFYNFPHALKPSLHFSTKLKVSRYDQKPLSSLDLKNSVLVEVTQSTSKLEAAPTTMTLPVPEDGDVHIEFTLQDEVVMLYIHAKFLASEETLELYKNNYSPSGSYIQILPISSLPAQIGLPLQMNVESTFQLSELHYVVSSRGQVVAAGTNTSSSFSLTPKVSWSPVACIAVYCVLSDGEVTSDTVHVPIRQRNYVSLNWSSDRAQPGNQVSLTVTVLEPGSQVGILVMGMDESTPEVDRDFKEEMECNIMVLTNGRLYKPDEAKKEGDALMVEKYWRYSMDQGTTESWLWLDTNVSDSTWTSPKVTVPDSITSWRAVALVMSENLGLGFTSVPQRLTVSQDFSLSLDVPSCLIRGEEIVLEVNIFNHLERDVEVILLVAQSETYEFVLADQGDVSVVNARKLTVGFRGAASALFLIRPLALGEMEISVHAVSAEASDNLVRTVLVKPEGVEQSFSETLFLELAPLKLNNSRAVSFSFPPDVVPGSQRAHVAVAGDILAMSIRNLDSLVQMPYGCGEQNMIHFAPSVYVLQYLDQSSKDHEAIRTRALGYIMEGYQRELSYQRDDGSFSAFGARDNYGSTWLTAFVLKCFLQAQRFIQVDQSVLFKAMSWLVGHQGPQGEFSEVGRVIHTELQGGLDDGSVALTAFVLISLLEDKTYVEMFRGNVSQAKNYLESRVSSGVASNYSLCLVAYALALANSPVAGPALAELNRRADDKDGVMLWSSSNGLESDGWMPHSAQIEMVSYMLLTLFRHGSMVEGISYMKWLSNRRNHLGGYGTTQDTVIALQALARYAAFSGSENIDLRFKMSIPASSSVLHFSINSSTYLLCQSQEIDAKKHLLIDTYMEGRGFASFQMNVFYNLESRVLSQRLQHATDREAFSLDVDVFDDERDHDHMLLSVCTRLQENQVISHTGMAMVDVGLLSGFTLAPGAAVPTDLIRKVEMSPGKVSLYLDSLNKSEVCIRLPLIRDYRVAHVQDAVVQVYDYYEPTRRAIRTYNSDIMHNMDPCVFCGTACSSCRAGITITVSSSLSFHSISSTSYSLGCLLVAITAFIM